MTKAAKKKPSLFVWLRSGLRSLSRKHSPIYEALADAKRVYRGDNPRQRFCYLCACCLNTFPAKQVQVDHISDAGTLTTWEDISGFMQRLFCDKDGLQILCHDCHDVKSYASRYNVSLEEAALQKDIIAICKNRTQDVIDFICAYNPNLMYNNALARKKSVETILRSIE